MVSCVALGLCWVDRTMASIRTGLSPSYSTVTCDLPSGRISGNLPERRASASAFVSRCASWIGAGYDRKRVHNTGGQRWLGTTVKTQGRTRMLPATGASISRSSVSDSFTIYELGFSLKWVWIDGDIPWHSTLLAWPGEKDAFGASK